MVELTIVLLCVGLLAAAVIPIIRGRYDAARWTEGRAIMGDIANGLRLHIAEKGSDFVAVPTLAQLGITPENQNGAYFLCGESGTGNFSWVVNDDYPMDFLVTATAPSSIVSPSLVTLNHTGTFTDTE